jgi:chromosome segregation ATPase
MRGTAIGLLLASLGDWGGLVWAAPSDSSSSRVHARKAAPQTIVSEASLEYFIGQAARLVQRDTANDISSLNAQLEALKRQKQKRVQEKGQLAQIDLEIKELLQKMESKRAEEQDIKDDIAAAQDALQRLNEALEKTASSYTAIVGATSLNTFVRSLSAEKKRETQNKVRRALAQLIEARRVNLLRLSTTGPAFQPAPKPLTAK